MVYYLSNIVNNREAIIERNPILFEAAKERTLYIANSLEKKVRIVSTGIGVKKGFFKEKSEVINENVDIIYIASYNRIFKYIFSMIFFIRYLIKNLKKEDKIIVYNANPVQVIALVFVRMMKKNEIIVEFEEFYRRKNEKLKNFIFSSLENILINKSEKFILTNKNMDVKIRRIRGKNSYSKCYSAGYLINEPNFKMENIDNDKIILYSGRLDYEGGIEIFLEALNYINERCKVIVCGSGSLEEKLKKYKCNNNLIDFSYRGFISREELNKLLNVNCICINPIRQNNLFSTVSFPSKILQYLQYGNVVVSSNIECIDLLGDLKKYIHIYDDDNPKKLALKISETLCVEFDKNDIKKVTYKFFDDDRLKLRKFIS